MALGFCMHDAPLAARAFAYAHALANGEGEEDGDEGEDAVTEEPLLSSFRPFVRPLRSSWRMEVIACKEEVQIMITRFACCVAPLLH